MLTSQESCHKRRVSTREVDVGTREIAMPEDASFDDLKQVADIAEAIGPYGRPMTRKILAAAAVAPI